MIDYGVYGTYDKGMQAARHISDRTRWQSYKSNQILYNKLRTFLI